MRLQKKTPQNYGGMSVEEFGKWIIDLGDGKLTTYSLENESDPTWIKVPTEFLIQHGDNPIQDIVKATYSELPTKYKEGRYLRERAILTPKNEDVERINSHILSSIPGKAKTYKSSDTICKASANSEEQDLLYPAEFLNSLKFSGIPNHELDLKVGSPIMLLRNINPSKGMCNGTRLIVTHLAKWLHSE
ncbi:hypothetical protein RJ639_024840 [Escallonia herrerae]|uniref:DNA helicase Pif1-like 2B domain-containing protein n=1 Tax=Escallonia herrerae TaxID=1293975 RepID=A0AA88UXB8_9ASTE|nr:hypothetical protein RJ639_024840 [Escallonia herrerae]